MTHLRALIPTTAVALLALTCLSGNANAEPTPNTYPAGPEQTLAPEAPPADATSKNTSSSQLIAGHVSTKTRKPAAGATVHLIQFHHEQGKDVQIGQVWPTTTVATTTADANGNYEFPQITRASLLTRSDDATPLNYSVKALTSDESGSTFFSLKTIRSERGDKPATVQLSSSPDIVMETANRTGSGTIPAETRSRTRGCDYTLKVRGGPVWARINMAYIRGDIGTSQYTFGTSSTSELGVGASVDFTPGVTLSQRGTNRVQATTTLKYPKYGKSSDASTQFQWNLFEEYCRIPTSGGPVTGYYSLVASPVGWYPSSAHAATNTVFPKADDKCLPYASGTEYTYNNANGRVMEREAKINLTGGGYGASFQASEKTDYQYNGTLTFTTGKYSGSLCGLTGYPYNEHGYNNGAIMLAR